MDLSVILCTYNRRDVLRSALESLTAQKTDGISYEILIIDNNSTDGTRETAQEFVERDPHFRYFFETQQGLSYARNRGIAEAQSDLLVFTDDDIAFSETWVQKNYEAGQRFPDAEYLGGRVLPIWTGAAPAWTKHSMAPFALSDLGTAPMEVSPQNPHCLVGASLAVRRRALDRAGLFSIETQRVKNSIGSTEDFDWQMKVWAYGGHGVYVPDVVCKTEVPVERLSKAYHRRWHFGHGKFNARGRRPQFEGARRLLGVPLFMYRQMVEYGVRSALANLRRSPDAFAYEAQFRFHAGFIAQRWRELAAQ